MSSAAALTWFARHEIRLAWREWLAMMTGSRGKRKRAIIALIVFAAIMHLPAYAVIGRFADLQAPLGKPELIVITATIFLAWALMLSQAIESVTRVFYARADLDLIMSSPANLANVFSVRIAAIALSVTGMALLLSTPFVDVLVIGGGIRWLSAFGVVIAIGLSAAAVAIAITVAAVPADRPEPHAARRADPGRHHRRRLRHRAPGRGDPFLRHAVALCGADLGCRGGLCARARQSAVVAGARGDRRRHGAVAAAGRRARAARRRDGDLLAAICRHRRQRRGDRTAGPPRRRARPHFAAVRGSRRCAPRNSCCCGAIPWLVSQSLMQLLYLVPPALMLWRSFSESSAAIVLITPVIVMAAGQLAGGLAWLTISGEDAADLVATAPLPPSRVTRAKIEVVLIAIGAIFAPLIAALAFASVTQAAVTALGVIIATVSAAAIQLWFRVQAKRSQFRRRQTSSRLATFAEAFCSIGWAATAALAVTIPIAAVISGAMTAAILAATWKISPRRD